MDYQIEKSVDEFTNTVSRSLPKFKLSSEIRLELAQESSPNGETIRLYFYHDFGDLDNGFHEERICFQNGFVIIRLNDLENIKLTFQEKDKVASWSGRVNVGGCSPTVFSYQGESNYVILNEETLKKISCSHSVAMYIEGTGTRRYRLGASSFKNFNVYCKTLYDVLYGTNVDNVINDAPTGTGMNYSNADGNQKKADASVGSKKQNEGYGESYLEYRRKRRRERVNTMKIFVLIILFIALFIFLGESLFR